MGAPQWQYLVYSIAWLMLLSLVLEAATEPDQNACDLENWLGEKPEVGMHVVCLRHGKSEVLLYPDGDRTREIKLAPGDGPVKAKLLLQKVLKSVKRVSEIKFRTANGRELRYKNQKVGLHAASGERISGNAGELSDGIYLIFEGGLWRWPPIRHGYNRKLESCTLITMSIRPAVFQVVVGDQWYKTLSDYVVPAALPLFAKSTTGDVGGSGSDDNIRSSETAWLSYSRSAELRKQEALTQKMLRVHLKHFEDNMQVVRYQSGQFYDSHRDYWDPREFPDSKWTDQNNRWHNRFATVLWYLKSPGGGGETWFPRARGEDIPWGDWKACDSRGTKVQALNGTAVLFYSLLASGELDEYSWHCGCPVKGEAKIAANSWVWSGVHRWSWMPSERDEL